MLPHPQTSTYHGWPHTSDLSIERRRRNHFTTAPNTTTSYKTSYKSNQTWKYERLCAPFEQDWISEPQV